MRLRQKESLIYFWNDALPKKYQRQQNTLYHKGGRFFESIFLKHVIGSQPIIEGTSLIIVVDGANIS